MTAGVPGLGLGGLFALLAAFCLPLLRNRPRDGAPHLFAMAIVIAAAAVLAWQTLSWLYSSVTSSDSGDTTERLARTGSAALTQPVIGHLFGLPVIAISVALLALLLLSGEVLFRVLGVRPTPLPPAIPAPPETVYSRGHGES